MKRTFKFRLLAVVITFLMMLSIMPVAVWAQDSETTGPEVEIIISYANAEPGIMYHISDQIAGSSDHYIYWFNGEIHYPDITIKVHFTDGTDDLILTEGQDYNLTFSYTPNESFSPMETVEKSDCYKEGFYHISISGAYGTTYAKMIDEKNAGTEWYAVLKKPGYNIYFNRNASDTDTESESSGIVSNGALIPEQYIPSFDNPGFKFVGWYTDSVCTEGNEFDAYAPLNLPYTSEGLRRGYEIINVYAKWEKEDDPTPGGDDPVPGGDGTDDTDGGKPSPDTGVENMMPLFMWLFAVSGLIIFSIKKKRA